MEGQPSGRDMFGKRYIQRRLWAFWRGGLIPAPPLFSLQEVIWLLRSFWSVLWSLPFVHLPHPILPGLPSVAVSDNIPFVPFPSRFLPATVSLWPSPILPFRW